jgi:hypothetical protein
MKANKNLIYLRRHRDLINMAEVAKRINTTNCRLSLIVNGKPYINGTHPQLTDKQTESLSNVIKELNR